MAKPIKIEILGDASGFKRALGNVDRGLSGMAKPMAAFGGALAGAFAVDKIISFGTELFNLSSNLTDINQKVDTVFAEQAESVRAWADTLNEEFGTTATNVSLMAANVADLLKPMGATTEEAAAMSQQLVELSPALAEWSGGTRTAAEVSEILSKAMLGEREQLKSLGISINQAEVDTRALQIAQEDGRDEITAMDKALATQALIFEKSTDAQAGYQGGTETLAGKVNLLKARFEEAKEFLATKLTPVFLKITDVIVRDVVPAVIKVRDWFKRWEPTVRDLVEKGIEKLREAIDAVMPTIEEIIEFLGGNQAVLEALGIVVGVVLVAAFAAWAVSVISATAPLIAIGVAAVAVVAIVRKLYEENETFRNIVQAVGRVIRDEVLPRIQAFGGWIKDELIPVIVEVATTIGDWIVKAWEIGEDIWDALEPVRNAIGDVVDVIQKVNDKFAEVLSWLWDNKQALIDAITAPFDAAFSAVRKAWDLVPDWFLELMGISKPGAGKALGGSSGLKGGGGRSSGGWGPSSRPGGVRAFGGSAGSGGMFRVGERGPENVLLPAGAKVVPSHASTGSRGDTFIFNQTMTTPQVAREIAWAKRIGDGR